MPTLTPNQLAALARAGSPNREIEAALGREMTPDERTAVDRARVIARLQKARKKQERKEAKVPDADPGKLLQPMPDHIATDMLSGILNISDRQIRKLAARGVLSKAGRGHYPWPKVIHEYLTFLRGGEQHNESAVRLRETKLRCQVLEQKIRDTKDAIIEETKAKDWQQVQDCLAAYRGELMRAAVTEPVRAVLNAAIARAVESVNAQAAKSISDGPREE